MNNFRTAQTANTPAQSGVATQRSAAFAKMIARLRPSTKLKTPAEMALEAQRAGGPKTPAEIALERQRGIDPRTGD